MTRRSLVFDPDPKASVLIAIPSSQYCCPLILDLSPWYWSLILIEKPTLSILLPCITPSDLWSWSLILVLDPWSWAKSQHPHCQSFFPALQSHSFAMQLPSFLSISSAALFVPMRRSTWIDSCSYRCWTANPCRVMWHCGKMEAPCSPTVPCSFASCWSVIGFPRWIIFNLPSSCHQFLSCQSHVSMFDADKLWHRT